MAKNGNMQRSIRAMQEDKAIAALLSTPSISSAAKESGIGQRTLHRWLDDPLFVAKLNAAKKTLIQSALNELQRHTLHAVRTLVELMQPAYSEVTRLGASRSILEYSFKAVAIEELERRLNAIEATATTTENSENGGPYEFTQSSVEDGEPLALESSTSLDDTDSAGASDSEERPTAPILRDSVAAASQLRAWSSSWRTELPAEQEQNANPATAMFVIR